MKPKDEQNPESLVREIKRNTRRKFNSEEKIRIMWYLLKFLIEHFPYLCTCSVFPDLNWYSHSEHLEKSDIENKLFEVRDDNKEKELFNAI